MKNYLHSVMRRFGFDVVLLSNIDRALKQREQERLQFRLRQIKTSREIADQVRGEQGTVLWVRRDELFDRAISHLKSVDVVLDIGPAFRPQRMIECATHICCEPFGDYLDRLMEDTKLAEKYVYLKAGVEQAARIFPARSVDTVFLLDVIEHVEKEKVLPALDSLKRAAREQVVIFTPIGYMPQEPSPDKGNLDPWGMNGVDWQRHRSGWVPEEFPPEEGWTVLACKDYHEVDGYGNQIESPFGALFAIWNRAGE